MEMRIYLNGIYGNRKLTMIITNSIKRLKENN